MNIKITRITAVVQDGRGDKLFLHTTLPNGVWPYNEHAALTQDVASGSYATYCDTNFPGVPVTVVQG